MIFQFRNVNHKTWKLSMMLDVLIGCSCGKVKAKARNVSPDRVNRVICGCSSCQAYAAFLQREPSMLDRYGGTDLFQISPQSLRFSEGFDYVIGMRLSRNGPLRWYADCCKTPIANTLKISNVPFMAVHCEALARIYTQNDRTSIIGRVRARVNSDGNAPDTGAWQTALMLIRFCPMILKWRLLGHHKHSPFFDSKTGLPLRTVVPRTM